MKVTSTPFDIFMKKILLSALLLVLTGSILAAESDAGAKKYPPYPDIWGWEYDNPPVSWFGAWPSSNGDILVRYVIEPPNAPVDNSGSRCRKNNQYGYHEFFGQTDHQISCDDFNDFHKRFAAPGTPPWPYQSGAVQFKDGSTLRAYGGTTTGCGDAYRAYYELKDPNGMVVWRKSVIYRRDKARILPCRNFDHEYKLTADTVGGSIAKLDDDTFLYFGLGGRYVVRFDKDFNSPYPYDRRRTIIVNYEDVKAVIGRARKRCDFYHDCLDEEMIKYLDALNR